MKIGVEGLLDELVHQFSDPMAFFRELVQNGIDAGTGMVEIEMEYLRERGEARIEVRDSGEGMTRRIIEGKLLRLFRSGKDEDRTKIGRFGIGFVSLFAIQPSLVVVDTGREGEYWRLIFGPDRRYELRELPHPVEGTTVEIYKPMGAGEFGDFLNRARQAVRRWCRYAVVPVEVNGELINEEFGFDGLLSIYHEMGASRVWMKISRPEDAFAGYYHRGLMIKEERGPRCGLPWVRFQVDSPEVEHTLTRDQLLESAGLMKVLNLLEKLATEALPLNLADQIEKILQRESLQEDELDELDDLYRWLGIFLEHCPQQVGLLEERSLFRDPAGEGYSLRKLKGLQRRSRLLFLGTLDRSYTAYSSKRKMAYPYIGQSKGLRLFLSAYLGTFVHPVDEKAIVLENLQCRELESQEGFSELTTGVDLLLEASGLEGPRWIGTDFRSARALAKRRGAAVYQKVKVAHLALFQEVNATLLGPEVRVFLNGRDAEVRKLMELAKNEPEWAAVALLRLLNDGSELLHDENKLLVEALRLREKRQAEMKSRAGR